MTGTDYQMRLIVSTMLQDPELLQKLKGDLDELDAQEKKSQNSLKDFLGTVGKGVAIVTGFGFAAKKAFDFAFAGAELEYAENRFNRLAGSIGTNGATLLRDLKEVTGGIYSNSQLIADAGDFISLGLATTYDEVLRLVSVAGQLNMNMNQLVLTLTNKTTMRFDSLGVKVAGFDEKLQALIDTGMDADAAFNEAFLQQAEAQLETVGSVVDEDLAKLQAFDAFLADLADSMKRYVADAVVAAIEGFEEAKSGYEFMNDQLAIAEDRIIKTSESYPEYISRMQGAADLVGKYAVTQEDYNQAVGDSAFLEWSAYNALVVLNEGQFEAEQLMRRMSSEVIPEQNEQWEKQQEEINELTGEMAGLALAEKSVEENARDAAAGINEMVDASQKDLGRKAREYADDVAHTTDMGVALTGMLDQLQSQENIPRAYQSEVVGVSTQIGIMSDVAQMKLDGLSTEQIAQNLHEGFDIPLQEAIGYIGDIESGVLSLDGLQAMIDVIINVSSGNTHYVGGWKPSPGLSGVESSGPGTGGMGNLLDDPNFGFAEGGFAPGGRSFVVGERHPEMAYNRGGGTQVVPNAGNTYQYNTTYHAGASQLTERDILRLMHRQRLLHG